MERERDGERERGRKRKRKRERERVEINLHFDGNPLSTNISEGIETGPVEKEVYTITTKQVEAILSPMFQFCRQNEPGDAVC